MINGPPNFGVSQLVLISKVQQQEFLSQLRSISICNVSYKVITKTPANRMKSVMGHLVAPNQCNFVSGRKNTDNVIIYQEVLHSTRQRKQQKGFMLIKVDLEKAYCCFFCKICKSTSHIGCGVDLLPLFLL